jgi:hypothetical protein
MAALCLKNMTIEALKWITGLLEEKKAPYLICGGFAAFAFGSMRPLNDIDIFIPEEFFDHVVNLGRKYVSKPAKRYFEESEGWNVKYVQFTYGETKIEVGSSKDVEIFDASLKEWVELKVDFSKVEYRSVYGMDIPFMAKDDLVSYKKVLSRPVDLHDIKAIQASA